MDKLIREEHKKYGAISTDFGPLDLEWSSSSPKIIRFKRRDCEFQMSLEDCAKLVKVLEAMGALPNLEIRDKVVTNG